MDTKIHSLNLNPTTEYQNTASAEAMMLRVQMLVAKDFDAQMRHVGEQMRFLGDIKKSCRERIAKMQSVLVQNPDATRKDGKRFIVLDAGQMADLFRNYVRESYDSESLSKSTESLPIKTAGNGTGLDDIGDDGKVPCPITNGEISSTALADYFDNQIASKNTTDAMNAAHRVGDDDSGLPFYHAHQNNKTANGMPAFCVLTDALDGMVERLKNEMAAIEEDAERLGVRLNELSAQRKIALEGAQQLLAKIEQVRGQTLARTA